MSIDGPTLTRGLDVDNRVYSSLDLSFDRTFWTRGNFPTYYVNGSETVKLSNPWVTSTSNAAPFDQGESPITLYVAVSHD
jgi:hypothetical protein